MIIIIIIITFVFINWHLSGIVIRDISTVAATGADFILKPQTEQIIKW